MQEMMSEYGYETNLRTKLQKKQQREKERKELRLMPPPDFAPPASSIP